jgi:hypothetical protein
MNAVQVGPQGLSPELYRKLCEDGLKNRMGEFIYGEVFVRVGRECREIWLLTINPPLRR